MSNLNFDLSVAWRIYPNISRTPLIHSNDKFKLVQTCLKSFINSTKGINVKYYFILDGCPDYYIIMLNSLINSDHIEIIQTDNIGNEQTFKKQIEILLSQSCSDIIYFAEDDYLYSPNSFHTMLSMIKESDVDFLSCYEHFDTFVHPIHSHKRLIKFHSNKFWYTDSSTCLTFLTTKYTLSKTKNIFLTYCQGNFDVSIWLMITKTFVWNPYFYLYFRFSHQNCYWLLIKTLTHGWRYLFTKSYKLWIPHSAIGTHLETKYVSPIVDWMKVSEDVHTI